MITIPSASPVPVAGWVLVLMFVFVFMATLLLVFGDGDGEGDLRLDRGACELFSLPDGLAIAIGEGRTRAVWTCAVLCL